MKWFKDWKLYHKAVFGILAMVLFFILISIKDFLYLDFLLLLKFIRWLFWAFVLYWIIQAIASLQNRKKKD